MASNDKETSKKGVHIENSQGVIVGNNNKISRNIFIDNQNSLPKDFDFELLASELLLIANYLGPSADSPSKRKDLVTIDEAQRAAEKGNGKTVLEKIKSVGGWVIDGIKGIGVNFAYEFIKQHIK